MRWSSPRPGSWSIRTAPTVAGAYPTVRSGRSPGDGPSVVGREPRTSRAAGPPRGLRPGRARVDWARTLQTAEPTFLGRNRRDRLPQSPVLPTRHGSRFYAQPGSVHQADEAPGPGGKCGRPFWDPRLCSRSAVSWGMTGVRDRRRGSHPRGGSARRPSGRGSPGRRSRPAGTRATRG